MKTLSSVLVMVLAVALGGCASTPAVPPTDDLFHDASFARPSTPIDPAAALAVSPAMHAYLTTRLASRQPGVNRRKRLIDALYQGDLKLEYDATVTRTAAEAFDARSGNCMALVLMTAAFARELGLVVHFQEVLGQEAWGRSQDLYIGIGHVNLLLEEKHETLGLVAIPGDTMVVDFLAPAEARTLVTRPIEENTLVAMYLNNRAVESLTQGQLDQAYWWARAAVVADPEAMASYVTLAVVYRTRHLPVYAEAVLHRVADRDPDNLYAMSNRILALRDLGRESEAKVLARRLETLDPHPPFSYFNEGMAALHDGRPDIARRLFAKEVERAPYHDEFEYWLAVSYSQLDDPARARLHLQRAMEVSTTRKDHDLYAAKLERLKALSTQ